jgi:hypothetical protein
MKFKMNADLPVETCFAAMKFKMNADLPVETCALRNRIRIRLNFCDKTSIIFRLVIEQRIRC